jgi:AcrR family transcriptional regulator
VVAEPARLLEQELTTESQRARRERMLSAAIELASEGGYEGVQMREVAERAGVALGTLYRYFPSKVHLLVAATTQEIGEMRDRLAHRPLESGDPVERVVAVIDSSTRYLQRNRNLTAALMRAMMSGDESVGVEVGRVGRAMTSIITWALRGTGEPTEHESAVASVLENVWYACIVSWLSGRKTADEVRSELALAARLLLRECGDPAQMT